MQTDLKGLGRTGMDPVSARFQYTNLGYPPLCKKERIRIAVPHSGGIFWKPEKIILVMEKKYYRGLA